MGGILEFQAQFVAGVVGRERFYGKQTLIWLRSVCLYGGWEGICFENLSACDREVLLSDLYACKAYVEYGRRMVQMGGRTDLQGAVSVAFIFFALFGRGGNGGMRRLWEPKNPFSIVMQCR